MYKSIFGILSALVSLGAVAFYVKEILKGQVKLAKSTRRLFLLLSLTILAIQAKSYMSWTLAFGLADVISQSLLFGLSFKYGIGGTPRLDKICYVIFGAALAGYLVFERPLLSMVCLIFADFAGFLPTLKKNYADPLSDSWVFFVVAGVIAPGLAIAASDGNGTIEIIFPCYVVIINSLAAFPLIFRRKIPKAF
jgi:hypothetical protein